MNKNSAGKLGRNLQRKWNLGCVRENRDTNLDRMNNSLADQTKEIGFNINK